MLVVPVHAQAGGAVAASQQRKQAVAAQQQMILQQQILLQQQQEQQSASANNPSEKVQDVVDINDLWKHLDKDGQAWKLIMDRDAKVMTVTHYAEILAREGVRIHKPATHYVDMIDSMSAQTPHMLKATFERVLSLMAILEYDYDNGENPDALARRFLGEERYFQNRQRLGLSAR